MNNKALTPSEKTHYDDLMSHLNYWEYLGVRKYARGTLRIGHIPHLAPEAYLHKLLPPLSEAQLQDLEHEIGLPLPNSFARFLRLHNGMNIFNFVLIEGLRTSYARSNIDDMMEQPYDIVMSNTVSRPRKSPPDVVFVGLLGDDRQPVALFPDGRVSLWDAAIDALKPVISENIFEFVLKETIKVEMQFDERGRRIPS